ncbi:unnamed protein product [Enterobius vermicularis]|uniref:Guanylate kinase-like domain-containing protein n=1 Tax=Enterobius vermicularis TaxID=51028 RepID=A0A0N4UYL0_ENTVE|nr:unnamed protein product [Enterobius vermicularis]
MEQEVAQLRFNADNLAHCLHSLLERIEQLEGTATMNRLDATCQDAVTRYRTKTPDEAVEELLKRKVNTHGLIDIELPRSDEQVTQSETITTDPETGLKKRTLITERVLTTKTFHAVPVDAKPLTNGHILASAYESRLVNLDDDDPFADVELDRLGDQVIVTSVKPGSTIAKDVHAGDTIVEVNGQPVPAVKELRLMKGNLSLKLVPTPIHQAPSVFYRVLSDYDADNDQTLPYKWAGLSVKRGEIIQVICNNGEWLQARKVNDVSRVGLVPSKQTIERVGMLTPYGRRVLVLLGVPGVGRRTIKSMLLAYSPQYFSTVTPFTSRSPKPSEQEGREYYFLNKEQMLQKIQNKEMIEWGEYAGNYYGTSTETVRACVRGGRVCVLDCAPQALRYLYNREFMPFVVVIAPPDISELRQINKLRPNPHSDEELLKTVAENKKLLSGEYSPMFHLILTNRSAEVTFKRLVVLSLICYNN